MTGVIHEDQSFQLSITPIFRDCISQFSDEATEFLEVSIFDLDYVRSTGAESFDANFYVSSIFIDVWEILEFLVVGHLAKLIIVSILDDYPLEPLGYES